MSKSTKIKKQCGICNTTFETYPSGSKSPSRTYCSKECYAKARAELIKPNTECLQCKTKVYRKPSELLRRKNIFCSRECKKEFESNSNDVSSADRDRRLTFHIKQERGDQCQVCKWPHHLVGKVSCDSHHIVSLSHGGLDEKSNIILLCPCCHRLAHKGFISTTLLQQKNQEDNNT